MVQKKIWLIEFWPQKFIFFTSSHFSHRFIFCTGSHLHIFRTGLYFSQVHTFTFSHRFIFFTRFTPSHFHTGLYFSQVHTFTFSHRFIFFTGSQFHIFTRYIFSERHTFTGFQGKEGKLIAGHNWNFLLLNWIVYHEWLSIIAS